MTIVFFDIEVGGMEGVSLKKELAATCSMFISTLLLSYSTSLYIQKP